LRPQAAPIIAAASLADGRKASGTSTFLCSTV
jgi:hypothetical protein